MSKADQSCPNVTLLDYGAEAVVGILAIVVWVLTGWIVLSKVIGFHFLEPLPLALAGCSWLLAKMWLSMRRDRRSKSNT